MGKWYEGDFGTSSSLGAFIFCLIFDLFGANLAPSDGLKDEHLHSLLKSILSNFSQYVTRIDSKCLADRFWALFNVLFPTSDSDENVSKCLVDVLIIFSNLIINNPQGNSFLISQFLLDKSRITAFLRSYLDQIDSLTNSQLSAHLNESELEFTTILVGILKFFDKLSTHVQEQDIQGSLATFPMPTFRRDSRGEVHRLGSRMKLIISGHSNWINFIHQHVWSIIYTTIPWNDFVE